MSGEVYGIACAFLWSLSSALLKSQTHKMKIIPLGALRTVPALLLYWGLLLVSGKAADPFHLPGRSWAFLVGSTVVGLVVGDQLYFRSMKLIGLSRAMPISTTYPFFTLLLALLFLDEDLGWTLFAGALLIASGAFLLAFPKGAVQTGNHRDGQGTDYLGVGLAFVAAMCWGGSTVLVRMGLSGVDVAVANTIRLSVLAIVLFAVLFRRGEPLRLREYGARTLGIVFLAGIIGTGLGTYAFLQSVQRAGAAKTSVLTAMTPLFGVPFSLILKERLSGRTILGTVLTVVGVGLTVY